MAALSAYVHEAIRSLAANPEAAAATVGTGATVYAGGTAMSYNKDNFMIDQGNRFGRFTAARANMNAQVGQYRFDIRGMTNISVTKAHVFLDTAQLFMCTSAALSCAGRVGMHGAAPPGWMCALYASHIFLGAMYLTICLWLGFHSGLRAQCGMVSLLTRKVRLPIPSLAMINQSRQFGSGYEKQKFWDILRFPWVSHPFDNPEIPGASSEEDEDDGEAKGKKGKKTKTKSNKPEGRAGDYAASDAFGSTGRKSVPSWIHDEQVVDKGTSAVPRHVPQYRGDLQLHDSSDPHDAPDHFKLFTEAQKEWFPYETYHKIALLYGVCCFMHGVCYYCVITATSELRGFWIAWATPGLFMTGQYWLLQLDIFKAQGQQFLKGFELFGQIAPYFAAAGATMEFRATYTKAGTAMAWVFAMACLTSHFLFACRFFDLMTPDTLSKEKEDEDGKSWWPQSWPVPLAFSNTLWQLTPPKKLKKGQHDLLHEAINLERQNGGICKMRRRRGKAPPGKRTKRATPQNPKALMHQVNDLENRFRSVWQHVVGKDQMPLNQLYGRWVAAHKEAQSLSGSVGSDSSGSGSESSGSGDGYADFVNSKGGGVRHSQFADRIHDVADELNHIEDALVELEKSHQVTTQSATKIADTGLSIGVENGTSTRGLPQTPYWIMRAATCTHMFIFFFLIVATSVEIVWGSHSLFAPPGEPPWIRNQKLRPYQTTQLYNDSAKNYIHLSTDPLPDWYRLFVASSIPEESEGHGGHGAASHSADAGHSTGHSGAAHGSHRRLNAAVESEAFNDLFGALPALDWLATEYLKDEKQEDWQVKMEAVAETAVLPTTMAEEAHAASETTSVPAGGFMTPSLRALPVEWPPLFEPRHLACQGRSTGASIAALTPRGFGALLHVKNSSGTLEGTLAAEQFALAGISSMGPLVGASWGTSGLHLVTKAGRLLHCPGHIPTDGAWPCHPDEGKPLPISPGATLRAGAIAEHASAGRTLALHFEDMPTTVVLYKEEVTVTSQGWRPAGEVHLPPQTSKVALGFAGDSLIMVTEDGAVHRRPLSEGAYPSLLPAPATSMVREWHAACATSPGDNGIVRLALRQGSPNMASAWRPELVVSATVATSPTPLVNV